MRSHLTRNVCRRLLAHHGLALPCQAPASRCLHRRPTPFASHQIFRHQQRRTLFGVFRKPPRELKEPELDPGYPTILQFQSRENDNVRPPPLEELVNAFRVFFRHKQKSRRTVNPTQAFCSLHLFRHILEDADGKLALSVEDLRTARDALLRRPKGNAEDHLELSKVLYQEIRRRVQSQTAGGSSPNGAGTGGISEARDFECYIAALTRYGASLEALDLLQREPLLRPGSVPAANKDVGSLWTMVIRGIADEGKEKELLNEMQEIQQAGHHLTALLQEIMIGFYARQNNVDHARSWFERATAGEDLPTPGSYAQMLRLSARDQKYQKWLRATFQELCDHPKASKEHWDIVLQWAVLALRKGVEDIKHMAGTMMHHHQGTPAMRPDASTINGLIQAAIENNDPILAERFISLGLELGVQPDRYTYLLQLDYRISANDFSGASTAFEDLDNAGFPSEEDHPVINKYIRALCSTPTPDSERILDVLSTIEQRRIQLEPGTVVSLCMAFLKNDQQYEVIDTLSLHTFQLSLEEREIIRKAFVAYCLDKSNSTARVWDGYSLLRQFFPETDATERIKLMHAFFARSRPDMACFVFGHMRAHNNPSIRPMTEHYVECLEGLGKNPDLESLKVVHNMLKMDTSIQLSTKVYNGLMIAYIACGEPGRALDFWQDITNSAEGPSYNSLATVFRACEMQPYGDKTARAIWAKMQRMDIDVPQFVFTAYCGAIAGQGHVEEVKTLIQENMVASTGYTPHMMTLGVAYNALPGQNLQANFETWAKETYPDVWERLLKRGKRKTPEGLQNFRIVREMKA